MTTAIAAPTLSGAPPATGIGGKLRWSISDTLTITRRNLLALTRTDLLFGREPWVAAFGGTPLEGVVDSFITEREGRWVVPVRSDAHERFPGIVHTTSASGSTPRWDQNLLSSKSSSSLR